MVTTGSIPLLQPHYWSETDLVNNMLEEARGILDCNNFKATYIRAMKMFSRQSALGISSIFDQAGRSRTTQLPPRVPVKGNKNDGSSQDVEPEAVSVTFELKQGSEESAVSMGVLGSTPLDKGKTETGPYERLVRPEGDNMPPSLPFVKCGTQLLSLSKEWFSLNQRTPMEVR